MDDESTVFLRGLYTAILTELPKIALNNDIKILDRAESYIQELKGIWEKDVMGKKSSNQQNIAPLSTDFEANENKVAFRSFSV
jgi:flagellar protein FliS